MKTVLCRKGSQVHTTLFVVVYQVDTVLHEEFCQINTSLCQVDNVLCRAVSQVETTRSIS